MKAQKKNIIKQVCIYFNQIKMKVLFLDFFGVLINNFSMENREILIYNGKEKRPHKFISEAIVQLQRIVKETKCKIVI